MRVVRFNYYLLLAIIVAPILLYVFGRQSELLYGLISLLVFAAFLFVSYRIQSRLNEECDQTVSVHLRRQTNIILTFIVAGIFTAIYSIIRYNLDSEVMSVLLRLPAWLVYFWGIYSLIIGLKESHPPA